MATQAPPPQENYGPTMLGVQWGLFAGATVAVLLRFHVRVIMRKTFGWDDFWMALAWLAALYMSIVMTLSVQAGYGQHAYYVRQNTKDILYYAVLAGLGVAWGITFVKLSITAFVLRLVAKLPKLWYVRWLCWFNVAMFVPITIATFVVFCLQCRPLSAYWRESVPADKCLKPIIVTNIVIAYSVAGAASDLLTGIIPILIIRNLQLSKARKIGLCIITGLVCMIAAVAILKAVVSHSVYGGKDPTYEKAPIAIYAAIEHEAGIIIACLPTFPVLYDEFRNAMTKKWRRTQDERTSFASNKTLTKAGGPMVMTNSAKSISLSRTTDSDVDTCTNEGADHWQDFERRGTDNKIVQTIEFDVEHGCSTEKITQ